MPQREPPNKLYPGYIFDLDGTLYLGNSLLPGAAKTVETLRKAGCKISFISNNPTYTRKQIADKLNSLGIPAVPGRNNPFQLCTGPIPPKTSPRLSLFSDR